MRFAGTPSRNGRIIEPSNALPSYIAFAQRARSVEFDAQPPPVHSNRGSNANLPPEIIAKTSANYREALRRLTT